MKITLESDYALRLVETLAAENKIIEASELSKISGVSRKFSLKILRKLMEAGIVCSYKGAHGGYRLKKESKDISLKEIIEIFEGKIMISRCLDGDYICSRMGSEKQRCAFHRTFKDISQKLAQILSDVSVQTILDLQNSTKI